MIFLGDFIDRGPKIRETLEVVQAMMADGQALAVMGNHEFNALAFHTTLPNRDDQSLRPRTNKNIRQHVQTLAQLRDSQLADALELFRKLPMWLDVGGLRAVHACWDEACMARIDASLRLCGGVSQAFLVEACTHSSPLFEAVEIVLKGRSLNCRLANSSWTRKVTGGRRFGRAGSRHRQRLTSDTLFNRTRSSATWRFLRHATGCQPRSVCPLSCERPAVFVGHYWLHQDRPSRQADNVACLDYSVAKDGFLCAYRWDGESQIDDAKFVWTN